MFTAMKRRDLMTHGESGGTMRFEPGFFQGSGTFLPPKPRLTWKARKMEKRNGARRNLSWKVKAYQSYEPPRLHDLEYQNGVKTGRFFPKRTKAPRAPRNTTSFIMRAKKSGGIASFVSPSPTPALIPTPSLSPVPRYREGLADEVNKEWGVNGYGSMNGLIRLRSNLEPGREDEDSESDVDQDWHAQSVQQLEQRLDHDLSRFEMIYPSCSPQYNLPHLLERRMDDQGTHIAHLEEENLTLKESLYLMQHELEDLQRRIQMLEAGVSDGQVEVSSEKSVGDASCAYD